MSEELPVDLVVQSLEEYQARTVDLYREHADDPEACIKALVRLHLSWTEEDPDRARMVSKYRGPVMDGPGRERLTASNISYFEETKRWKTSATDSGAMPSISFNILHALVFAPTQELAKHWLGGRLKHRPTDYAEAMGDAAWAGISAAGAAMPNRKDSTEMGTS